MLNIAICDDDAPLCTGLVEIVKNHCTTKEIDFEVSSYYRGEDFVKSLKEGRSYDLIFLDIEIKTMTGVEIGSVIRNELDDHITKIVFITSKQGYEQALFDVQPLNFIKKPLDIKKVKHCIDLTLKLTQTESLFFEYKIGKEIYKEKLARILYFEAQGKKVKMVTQTEKYQFIGKLSEILPQLPKSFVQIHRSYVANIHLSTQISSSFMKMVNEEEIPIGRSKLEDVRGLLFQLSKEKQYGTL